MDTYKIWLNSVSKEERGELEKINGNAHEINERFGAELEFGTAGMRGEVGLGTFRMNIYTVRRATAGLAEYITTLGESAMQRGVVISYDTRRLSREFAFGASEVLSAYKIKSFVYEDVRPVPMCSFAVRRFNAVAGIMITASHNPKEYNGYKVYGEDGAQMSPAPTAKVVDFIKALTDYFTIKRDQIKDIYSLKGKDNFKVNEFVTVIGKKTDDAFFNEIEKLSLSPELTKAKGKDIKLVYTPIHGSGYMPVTEIFKRLGINAGLVKEQCAPDTEFSTVEVPNPENPSVLRMGCELGNKTGADVVLATDPDADRLGVAVRNNKGEFVLLTGNQIGVLLLDYICTRLIETGKMPKNPAVVKSIVSTTLADRLCESHNVTMFNVLTGFKFIGEKIKEWEESKEFTYIFGFEESYGTLFGTHARDKDAVVGAMMFAEASLYWESKGRTMFMRLNELFEKFGFYAEKNISITYKGISAMADMAKVMADFRKKTVTALAGEEVLSTADFLHGTLNEKGKISPLPFGKTDAVYLSLKDKQFICIRPSGTEPKLKIYVLIYDNTEKTAIAKADKLMDAVKELL
ncbi:MAG: phospho-sugar mutase [Firmicutes bacterium]|nr:phospho-sugar mutase [Bacillota bacterium]